MGRVVLFSALAVGAAVALANKPAWAVWGNTSPGAASGGGLLDAVLNAASGVSVVRVAAMRSLDKSLLGHANVQAFLRVIRSKESNQTPGAYSLLVGGGTFSGFADHPRIFGQCWVTAAGKKLCSSAAGAYQFTAPTWDETRAALGLSDFSPINQDLAALGRIAARGALADVLAGNVERAVSKLALEWEAFSRWPDPAPYKNVFLAYGGSSAGGVA